MAKLAGAPARPVTGPGITTRVGMEAADLGILRWDPARNAIAAMFGDNFPLVGMTGDPWLSPSIVMYDDDHNVLGVPDPGNRITMRPRRQLWPYPHNNPDYDTVLPCDFIRVGDWWYVAVMLSKGPLNAEGAQFRTEFHRSRDLVSWEVQPILKLDHVRGHPGAGILSSHPGTTMLTFDRIGDWVYIFGTGGLIRNKGIWMWRNRASDFPLGRWEPWGFDGRDWGWGIANENSPILEGAYGELSFRCLQGHCVLSYLDVSAGESRQEARTVQNPEDNWRDTPGVAVYATGSDIPHPYGGYISPRSRLDEPGGMQFFVSQWLDSHNYRVYLVRGTLAATAELCDGSIAVPTTPTHCRDGRRQRRGADAGTVKKTAKPGAAKTANQRAAATMPRKPATKAGHESLAATKKTASSTSSQRAPGGGRPELQRDDAPTALPTAPDDGAI